MFKKFIEIYSLDEKKYYIFRPGTSTKKENKDGITIFPYDFYYLDENFNKFIGNRSVDTIDEYVKKLNEQGLDAFVGPHSPEIEDQYGDFVPYQNPNIKGAWKRPTEIEYKIYSETLKKEQEETNVKKLA